MELQFNRTAIPYLKTVIKDSKCQEQTQEIRLDEGMPDVGRVVACWGQVLLRGKEWRSEEAGASGGVMAWVLYQSEDGSELRCVDCWLPLQLKWDFSERQPDGSLIIHPYLRSLDARTASARKLIVRACVNMHCEAFVPSEMELYSPGDVPEDLQLQKRQYTLDLPGEAGEKAFQIEEDLTLPGSAPALDKILYYSLHTELVDHKVMTDKAIFRGAVLLHILYLGKDGGMHTWDFEIPFSQFTQLDTDYDSDVPVRIDIAATSTELDNSDDGSLHLKAAFIGQYVVYMQVSADIVADAYSNLRQVQQVNNGADLPRSCRWIEETIHAECVQGGEMDRIVDVTFNPDHPRLNTDGEMPALELSGVFRIFGYDHNGMPAGEQIRWEKRLEGTEAEIVSGLSAKLTGIPQFNALGGNSTLRADIRLSTQTTTGDAVSMVNGLELGDVEELDPDRPSIILKRMGKDSLWELAKKNKSTVSAILAANRLEQDPSEDQLLLIPVT